MTTPPKYTNWATDAGRTLEPPQELKDAGWADNTKPPARIMNWLHNINYQWNKFLHSMLADNWIFKDDVGFGPFTYRSITLLDASRKWLAISTGGGIRRSYNAHEWIDAGAITGFNNYPHNLTTTLTRFLVGSSNDVQWSSSGIGGTWTTESTTTLTNDVSAIATKTRKDGDNFTMIGSVTSEISFVADVGVGGTWASPSTGITGTNQIKKIVYIGSDTWLALTSIGEVFVSSDDGDTWAELTNHPKDVGTTVDFHDMDYDSDNGVLIVVGASAANNARIHVTYDFGATAWSNVGMSGTPPTADDGLTSLVHHSGDLWFACGPFTRADVSENILIAKSLDKGATWECVSFRSIDAAAVGDIYELGKGRDRVLAVGDSMLALSLSVGNLY